MNIFDHISKPAAIVGGATLVLALSAVAYFSFSGGAEAPQAVTRIEASPLEGALGRELLVTLSRLRSTTLDAGIFTDPVFTSLRDFGVEIAPQPVGRRNPFAALDQKTATAKGGGGAKGAVPAIGSGSTGKTAAPPSTEPEDSFGEFEF